MKDNRLALRLEDKEKQAFEKAAELAGLPVSAWIRERLRKIAKSELEKEGESIPFLRPSRA